MANLLRRGPTDEGLGIALVDGHPVGRVPEVIRAQIQYLCTRFELHDDGVPPVTTVTSAISGEGVTTVSRGLAAVLSADLGRRVCLVDANWWGPGDSRIDGVGGLAAVLKAQIDIVDTIIATADPRLSIIGSGTAPTYQWARLAKVERVAPVLAALSAEFDHVIVDLPAVRTSTVAMSFSAAAGNVLLVTRQGASRVDQVDRAIDELSHTNLMGIVLNDYSLSMPEAFRSRLLDV